MSTSLTRFATSQSSSYPIVITRLGGYRSRPNSHLKFVEVPGIDNNNNNNNNNNSNNNNNNNNINNRNKGTWGMKMPVELNSRTRKMPI